MNFLIIAISLVRIVDCSHESGERMFDPEMMKHDGSLGVIPLVFKEEDETSLHYQGDSIEEFLALCKNASCEMCPPVFTNGNKLHRRERTCDTFSEYNFKLLKLAQKLVQEKVDEKGLVWLGLLHFLLYLINVLLGILLLLLKHFRFKTLFNPFEHDPTRGPRVRIYMLKGFKFRRSDKGTEAEDVEHVPYNGDPEHGPTYHASKPQNKSLSMWPWELPDYDFSQIAYWASHNNDEGSESDFNSNI